LIHRLVCIAAALAAVTLMPGPHASARPEQVAINGIYRAEECRGHACKEDRSRPLAAGEATRGTLQIHVSTRGGVLGVSSLRIEIQLEKTNGWLCVDNFWLDGAREFSGWTNWDTTAWPGEDGSWQCPEEVPHAHNVPIPNGTHTLRAVAEERGTRETLASAPVKVSLANPPRPPRWAADPRPDARAVTLRWTPSAEPDIVEYTFVRLGPDGSEAEFAVSAANPGANGCQRPKGAPFYQCTDRLGAADPGGIYEYALFARRATPSGGRACAVVDRPCLESAPSEVRKVAVAEPATRPVAPADRTTATSGPTQAPDASGTLEAVLASPAPNAPVAVHPQGRRAQIEAARSTGSRALVGGAAALLLGGAVASIAFLRLRGLRHAAAAGLPPDAQK
jgi:hypothetical protein